MSHIDSEPVIPEFSDSLPAEEADTVPAELNDSEDEGEEEEVLLNAGDDLDALLQESQDAVPDLDDLLDESLAQVAEDRAAKAARDRLKRGGQSAVERQEDLERIRAWEAAHLWEAKANVACFTRYLCACGTVREVFTGLMRREAHRHVRGSQHWVRVPSALAALPNEVTVTVASTPLCYACALDKGWNLAEALVWEDRHLPGGRRNSDAP